MINIYIINEYITSQKNGIGTYIRELINLLINHLNIEIYLIELNYPTKEFEIIRENKLTRICFPTTPNYFMTNSFIVPCLIKLYYKDSENNIFLFNHSPSNGLIRSIKDYFPLSKIVFIVHDLSWTSPLFGNKALFEDIMNNNKTEYKEIIEETVKFKQQLKLINKTICLSQVTANLLIQYYDAKKENIDFIPHFLKDQRSPISAIERKKIKQDFGIKTNERIIISVGRLTKTKGTYVLINAFKNILDKYPKTKLILIGSMSNPDNLLKHCSDIRSQIIFTGHISFEELKKWYQIADVGVIPSYTEQIGYNGIEMLMFGLPIVTSDRFGVEDMFQNFVNAIIAKIEDYNDSTKFKKNLSVSVIEILSSKKLQKALRKSARITYENQYTSKQALINYQKIFSENIHDIT